jgi:HAD superfamily hydrolase (TIGR01509 family)
MLRAAIFDLDGLLIDSEPLWRRAEREGFARVGLRLTDEDCRQTTGLRIDLVVDHWHTRFPWEGPPPPVVAGWILDRVIDLVRGEGQAKPGAHEAVASARRAGLRLAVASSSPMPLVTISVQRLGLAGSLDVLESAGSGYPKPHPAVFLSAAGRLGVDPTECVVLEDSLHGVIAAKAARMACIAVPEAEVVERAPFAVADLLLGSLLEVDEGTFARLSREGGAAGAAGPKLAT